MFDVCYCWTRMSNVVVTVCSGMQRLETCDSLDLCSLISDILAGAKRDQVGLAPYYYYCSITVS